MRAIQTDYRTADLSPPDRAMLDFVAKLTRSPSEVERADLDGLRGHGFDDAAIHDVVQVASLFAYYNRLADGLGVDLEPGAPPAANGRPAAGRSR